jgi:hypothetical protein
MGLKAEIALESLCSHRVLRTRTHGDRRLISKLAQQHGAAR